MTGPDGIPVQLNGEERLSPAGLSLEAFLHQCGYEPRLVVVEFNGSILPRRHWSGQPLRAGDVLEVVTIVGGGT